MIGISLQTKELSDRLAIEPLGRFLTSRGFDINTRKTQADVWIEPWSDIGANASATQKSGITIDTAILKHCNDVEPDVLPTLKEFEIDPRRPYVLLAYPTTESLKAVQTKVFPEIDVVIYGGVEDKTTTRDERRLRAISGHGKLAALHAGACATIWGCNFEKSYTPLHNIVEGTAGGPLFMVEPTRTGQFGYGDYKRLGLLQVCANGADVINQVVAYVADITPKKICAHRKKRREQILRNKEYFFPLIEAAINSITLDERPNVPETLQVTKIGKTTHIIHTESTDWPKPRSTGLNPFYGGGSPFPSFGKIPGLQPLMYSKPSEDKFAHKESNLIDCLLEGSSYMKGKYAEHNLIKSDYYIYKTHPYHNESHMKYIISSLDLEAHKKISSNSIFDNTTMRELILSYGSLFSSKAASA